MNRVRLAERSESAKRSYGSGIRASSSRRTISTPPSRRGPPSRRTLCPKEPALWKMAFEAAGKVLAGGKNPFIQTLWEQENGLSLVRQFLLPKSVQPRGPTRPGRTEEGLEFIGDVMIGEKLLPRACPVLPTRAPPGGSQARPVTAAAFRSPPGGEPRRVLTNLAIYGMIHPHSQRGQPSRPRWTDSENAHV
jgi:hypothetical protein